MSIGVIAASLALHLGANLAILFGASGLAGLFNRRLAARLIEVHDIGRLLCHHAAGCHAEIVNEFRIGAEPEERVTHGVAQVTILMGVRQDALNVHPLLLAVLDCFESGHLANLAGVETVVERFLGNNRHENPLKRWARNGPRICYYYSTLCINVKGNQTT
jgi:hypothetical protein